MFKDEKLGVRAHEKRGKGLELRTNRATSFAWPSKIGRKAKVSYPNTINTMSATRGDASRAGLL
jgi:hypothetical protein